MLSCIKCICGDNGIVNLHKNGIIFYFFFYVAGVNNTSEIGFVGSKIPLLCISRDESIHS
jgi:hypothetical protein